MQKCIVNYKSGPSNTRPVLVALAFEAGYTVSRCSWLAMCDVPLRDKKEDIWKSRLFVRALEACLAYTFGAIEPLAGWECESGVKTVC